MFYFFFKCIFNFFFIFFLYSFGPSRKCSFKIRMQCRYNHRINSFLFTPFSCCFIVMNFVKPFEEIIQLKRKVSQMLVIFKNCHINWTYILGSPSWHLTIQQCFIAGNVLFVRLATVYQNLQTFSGRCESRCFLGMAFVDGQSTSEFLTRKRYSLAFFFILFILKVSLTLLLLSLTLFSVFLN